MNPDTAPCTDKKNKTGTERITNMKIPILHNECVRFDVTVRHADDHHEAVRAERVSRASSALDSGRGRDERKFAKQFQRRLFALLNRQLLQRVSAGAVAILMSVPVFGATYRYSGLANTIYVESGGSATLTD